MHIILESLCTRSAGNGDDSPSQWRPLTVPIFAHPATVSIVSFRERIHFLSGMGDFGRVNAHRTRWSSFPGLRESESHKRACLFCWAWSKHLVEDSEWHSVFSCSVGNACRRRFKLALSQVHVPSDCIERPENIFETPFENFRLPISADLARLIILCRENRQLVDEFARFVVDLTGCRKGEFAKLAVRDIFPETT